MWRASVLFASAALVLGSVVSASADAGDLDPTFAGDGWAVVATPDPDPDVAAFVARPDGSIVVVGSLSGRSAVWAFLPNGTIDGSFGTDGVVLPLSPEKESSAGKALLLPDGRIVAVGDAGRHARVVSLLPDGSLDPSFGGGDGIAWVRFGEGISTRAGDVALLADGDLLIGGGYSDRSAERSGAFLARLQPDGRLDTSFGSGGVVTRAEWFNAMIADGDHIVLAVQRPQYRVQGFKIVRYDASGALDPTWGDDGVRRYCVFEDRCDNYDFSGILDLAEDAEGRLVLVFGGYFVHAGVGDSWGIMRLTTEGARDEAFSGDGLVTLLPTGLGGAARAVAVQADGSLVVSGDVDAGGGSGEVDPAIALLQPDGTLDTTFGEEGVLDATPIPGFWAYPKDIAIQADGKIVLLADSSDPQQDVPWDFALARFLGA